MLTAILDISIIENCLHFGLYNILVYSVTFIDHGFGSSLMWQNYSLRAILLIVLGL